MALLEVVLSVAIFVTVASVGLMSLSACVRAVSGVKLEAQASDLAVTMLSEVQMGVLDAAAFGPEPFDPPDDAWTWQVAVVDQEIARDIAPMLQVEVIVANSSQGYVYRLAHLMPAPAQTTVTAPPSTTGQSAAPSAGQGTGSGGRSSGGSGGRSSGGSGGRSSKGSGGRSSGGSGGRSSGGGLP